MGYPPIGMPVTPGYRGPPHRMPPGEGHIYGMYPPPPHNSRSHSVVKTESKPREQPKNTATSPRTPGIRIKFDPATSRKKRKLIPGEMEPTKPYFGEKIQEQPKTTALAVFAFLSNDDLYHAGLV